MRLVVSSLLIIILGLTLYHLAVSHVKSEVNNVYMEGRKIIITGFENPLVKIEGCGQSIVLSSHVVDININCTEVNVKVYSKNRLIFNKTLLLNS